MVDPLVIVGPTASGKSSVAMELAKRHIDRGEHVEIVSADSMQVYRSMDIGTAKPSLADQNLVPHHLIDVVDPDEDFSVAEYVRLAKCALDGIATRGARAIVVGGTGLYVQALVDGMEIPGQFPDVRTELETEPNDQVLYERLCALDPFAASRMEPTNRRRIIRALEVSVGSGRPFSSYGPGLTSFPPAPFVLVGIDVDRDDLSVRIRRRLDQQVVDGFLAEVTRVYFNKSLSRTSTQALGYKELTSHLTGECTLEEAVELAALRSRQFAVRQIKWFRRDPRIRWFSYGDDPIDVVDEIAAHWENSGPRI